MNQTIKLHDIFSADLFSRSRAAKLPSYINSNVDQVILDFDGINFISRSFADEVCNLIDDHKNIHFDMRNQNQEVATMMMRVTEGRQQERKRGIAHPKMYEFDNMESLSAFLLTM